MIKYEETSINLMYYLDAAFITTFISWFFGLKLEVMSSDIGGNVMNDSDIKVIKISKKALFEFIYEKFIECQGTYFDENELEVGDNFDIDWKTGEFIFCIHKMYNSDGKPLALPQEINLKQLLKIIPDTTSSMYSQNRYRIYTKDRLVELSRK